MRSLQATEPGCVHKVIYNGIPVEEASRPNNAASLFFSRTMAQYCSAPEKLGRESSKLRWPNAAPTPWRVPGVRGRRRPGGGRGAGARESDSVDYIRGREPQHVKNQARNGLSTRNQIKLLTLRAGQVPGNDCVLFPNGVLEQAAVGTVEFLAKPALVLRGPSMIKKMKLRNYRQHADTLIEFVRY